MNQVLQGDCLELMKTMDDNSVDAIVTDPPYGLSIIGWDNNVPSQEIWEECLRVLKPGGYLLSFASTRTQHLITSIIEKSGFKIRDTLAWVYTPSFPKGMNIKNFSIKHGASMEDQKKCEGFHTTLCPSFEPITMASKPIEKNLTILENFLKYGTGGLNTTECLIKNKRLPSNLIHDFSDNVIDIFPTDIEKYKNKTASRFFYCEKPSISEKEYGCDELEEKTIWNGYRVSAHPMDNYSAKLRKNNHPSVKPTALMEYLIKLVSKEGAIVLDPFGGSGSTAIACQNTGRNYIIMEKDENYVKICEHRLAANAEKRKKTTERKQKKIF